MPIKGTRPNYERWNVERMSDYEDFCGFSKLRKLIEAVKVGIKEPYESLRYGKPNLIINERERDKARAIIATTFETGARIGEVLGRDIKNPEEDRANEIIIEGLHADDFTFKSVNELRAVFKIEKKYEQEEEEVTKYKAADDSKMRWESKEAAIASQHPFEEYEGYNVRRKKKIRKIVIPANEPLVDRMMDWVERRKEEDGEGAKLFTRRKENWKYETFYNWFYRVLKRAGQLIGDGNEWTPHRLRAERATHIMTRYDLPEVKTNEWFEWVDEAKNYATLKEKAFEDMMEGAEKLYG